MSLGEDLDDFHSSYSEHQDQNLKGSEHLLELLNSSKTIYHGHIAHSLINTVRGFAVGAFCPQMHHLLPCCAALPAVAHT